MGLRRTTVDENLQLDSSLTCTAPAVRLQVQVLGGNQTQKPAKASTPMHSFDLHPVYYSLTVDNSV